MTDVILHFDAEPGQDRVALAQELQERCAKMAEIEAARSNPMDTRVVGADDILLVLTISAKILGAGALTLEGLHRVLVGVKKIANDLGLKRFTVEGDGGLVSLEELTEGDAKFIGAASKPTM
jgi:hypothetical protein